MNKKQKCIILSLCLHIAYPRKPWEFYLSYTMVEGAGDKGRRPRILRPLRGVNVAPEDTQAANPAFDVTPNKYITAIITEKGIIREPYVEGLKRVAR